MQKLRIDPRNVLGQGIGMQVRVCFIYMPISGPIMLAEELLEERNIRLFPDLQGFSCSGPPLI